MKKVVHFTRSSYKGGAGKIMIMIMDGIALNHLHISYGKRYANNSINAWMTKDLTVRLSRIGIKSYTFSKYFSKLMFLFRPLMILFYLRKTHKINQRSNILHFHYGNAIRDAYWLSKLGYYVVYTLHQVPTKNMLKYLLRAQKNNNFQLVVVSNYLYELLSKAGIQKMRTIVNGINFDHRIQVTPWRKLAKEKQTNILCIGRFNQEKGLDLLIDCIEILIQENFRLKCIILGDGPLLESYLKSTRLRKLNEFISLLGFQDDLHPFLVEADLYIQPSRQETFSLSLLEAMAYGKRCIISDGTGMTGILKGLGFCFSNGSVNDLVRVIRYIIEKGFNIDSSPNQISKEAKKYDLDLMLKEYSKIYDNALCH